MYLIDDVEQSCSPNKKLIAASILDSNKVHPTFFLEIQTKKQKPLNQ